MRRKPGLPLRSQAIICRGTVALRQPRTRHLGPKSQCDITGRDTNIRSRRPETLHAALRAGADELMPADCETGSPESRPLESGFPSTVGSREELSNVQSFAACRSVPPPRRLVGRLCWRLTPL